MNTWVFQQVLIKYRNYKFLDDYFFIKGKNFNIQQVLIFIRNDTTDYLDDGNQDHLCQLCHAKLWKNEATRKKKTEDNETFSLCCGYGKVELPPFKQAQENYKHLFRCEDSKGKFFMNNIRRYNSMFSFTSMGGKVDTSINRGKGPFIYRLSGQNFHAMGSLLPTDGSKPKFSQLYIYDTENEISNRQCSFRYVLYNFNC